jgi:hypothetical protein
VSRSLIGATPTISPFHSQCRAVCVVAGMPTGARPSVEAARAGDDEVSVSRAKTRGARFEKLGAEKSRLAAAGALLFADASVPFEHFDAAFVLDDVGFEVRGEFCEWLEFAHDVLMVRVKFSVEAGDAHIELIDVFREFSPKGAEVCLCCGRGKALANHERQIFSRDGFLFK